MLKVKNILWIILISSMCNAQTFPYTEFKTDFVQTPVTTGTYTSSANNSFINVYINATYYGMVGGYEGWKMGLVGYVKSCGGNTSFYELRVGTGGYTTYMYIPNPTNQLDYKKPLDCWKETNDVWWYTTVCNLSFCNISSSSTINMDVCYLNRTWYNSLDSNQKKLRLIITSGSNLNINTSIFNSTQENSDVSWSETRYLNVHQNLSTIRHYTGRLLSDTYTDLGCGNLGTTTTTTTLPFNLSSNICFLSSAYTTPNKNSWINLTDTLVSVISQYGYVQSGYTNSSGKICFNVSYLSNAFFIYGQNLPYYEQKTFFDGVTKIELLTLQTIYGYVWLPFDRIPMFNLTVNVSKGDYNINMANNLIYVKSCSNNDYYSCNDILLHSKYTDTSGNYAYQNLIIPTRYFLVTSSYFDTNNDLLEWKIIDTEQYNTNTINVSFNYGIRPTNEYCIDFVDSIYSDQKINNTIFDIRFGGISLLSGTYLKTKKCFNDTRDNLYYSIEASNSQYDTLSISKVLDIGDNNIPMTLKDAYVNATTLYIINGTIYGNNIKLSNVKISIDCKTIPIRVSETYTDINGYYIFTNITKNSECSVTPNTYGSYVDFSQKAKIYSNTIFNFYLTNNSNVDNRKIINVHVGYKNIYDDIQNIENAKITIRCNGYNDKSLYSDISGSSTFSNMPNKADCNIEVLKTGYVTKNDIDIGDETYIDVILEPLENMGCWIYGNTILKNNTVSSNIPLVNVKIFDGSTLVNTIKSDDNGYFEFQTQCNKNYNIVGNYNGIENTVSVKTKSSEGGIKADIEFTVSDVQSNYYLDTILALFGALFGFILLMMFTFLLLIFLKILSEMNKL